MEAGRESRVSGEVAAYSDARTSVIATSPSSELRPLMPNFAQQFRAEHVSVGSRLCEHSLEPRTRRIVFSIVFSQEKSPVQSVSTTMKLRHKFYAQVQRRSFHTAWVQTGSGHAKTACPFYPQEQTSSGRPGMSEKCHERTH